MQQSLPLQSSTIKSSQPAVFYLLQLLVLLLAQQCRGSGLRTVKFVANKQYTQAFANPAELVAFKKWFANEDAVAIASLNPGVERIEPTAQPPMYIGHLESLSFPGLKVKSSVSFQITKSDSYLKIVCSEGSLKQSYEGNAFFANLVSKLSPTVVSQNVFGFTESGLFNNAELTIQFSLPASFPISADLLEAGGSKAISIGLDKDLPQFLKNVLKSVSNSKSVDTSV